MLNVHKVNRSLILPYSSAEMYDLANNVEAYDEFLPWCSCSAVLERDEACAIARIDVSYKGMKSSFTTRNELTPKQHMLTKSRRQKNPLATINWENMCH